VHLVVDTLSSPLFWAPTLAVYLLKFENLLQKRKILFKSEHLMVDNFSSPLFWALTLLYICQNLKICLKRDKFGLKVSI